MQPSIGRIVHLNSYQGPAAALIVGLRGGQAIDLQVFYEDGRITFLQNVDQGYQPGQWNWPPRV